MAAVYQISVDCTQPATVTSMYMQVHDPEGLMDIAITSVSLVGNVLSSGPPPWQWSIQNVTFDPGAGAASLRGYELFSQLDLHAPIGIPNGGRLALVGPKANFSGNETIDVGIVYFGAPGACRIVIVDN